MLKKRETLQHRTTPAFKGGEGVLHSTILATPEEMMGKGRVFNRILLESGCSIGTHTHVGDAEFFYILSGHGVASDDGIEIAVEAGDVVVTADGHAHGLRNDGQDPLELLALVLYS